MDGALLRDNLPTQITDRMSNHGTKMCKVLMQPGWDCIAKAGSMVAIEGLLDMVPDPPGFRQMFKQFRTGEYMHIMQVSGQGVLYLADYGNEVIVIQLANEGISVNSRNVLAFDAHLEWNIQRQEGLKMFSGGGMYNVTIKGSGWVALSTKGVPMALDCAEAPTAVDTDALVAYTLGLETKLKKTGSLAGKMVGRDTGEQFQLQFKGQGFVLVQPSEDHRPFFSLRG
ncbi:MAG: AIM24 family protein [Jatrophihabitans sp.]|uniref:AIM24 family protein n=1 Tax=Jatrophihabitans sp. TaxID=1932789 RepID=UPI003F7EA853